MLPKTVVYVTFGFRPTVESESNHRVIFVVTVNTGGCRYGNLQGHQWQEIWNCDNYRFWIQAIHTHQMTPLPTIFEGLWYESCAIQTGTHSLSVGCRTDSGSWPLIGSCAWWRHQMETFSALLAICAGNSPVTGDFPTQRPVTWSFDVLFDLSLNERLIEQSWGCWIETLSRQLGRHSNGSHVQVLTLNVNSGCGCKFRVWLNVLWIVGTLQCTVGLYDGEFLLFFFKVAFINSSNSICRHRSFSSLILGMNVTAHRVVYISNLDIQFLT